MADLTCHHGLRYGTCLDCGEHPERYTASDETDPVARHADTLRTLNGARAIIREACAALGCEPSTLASTALEARQRVAALEAEVAKLRRARDEARARLTKVGEAMECAGNRWDEWGVRAETVGEMLHDALSGSVGEGVA